MVPSFVSILYSCRLCGATIFGTFLLYCINILYRKKTFAILHALFAKYKQRNHVAFTMVDALFSSALFGVAAFIISSPTTVRQALVIGLGATGTIAGFTKDSPLRRRQVDH